MADAPEMVVVDPDAPTDQSVKQTLMSLPTWEKWLQDQGFKQGFVPQGGAEWIRWYREIGRGWKIVVWPTSSFFFIRVYNNPLRYGSPCAAFHIGERTVLRVLAKVMGQIEREVSDATKKRGIAKYAASVPYEKSTGSVFATEAMPLSRPIPDDPAELDKPQMDQMLDRIQTTCFPKGQRVRVKRPHAGTLTNALGTVVSASPHACYVAIDHYVEAGDADPFRFAEDELEPVYENQEPDLDDPAPYLAALDYITPLKKLGYLALKRDYYTKHIQFDHEKQGVLTFGIKPMPNALSTMTVVIFIDYYQGGESERIGDMVVEALDVVDRVRELEALADSTANIAEFARKLAEKNYRDSSVFSHYDHLVHVFGESAEDVDDPAHYMQELQRHSVVVDAFRKHGVKMGRRMGAGRNYYRLFYIPSAVTDVSYDLYLEPLADNSWSVTAEGSKSFEDDRGSDWQQEFDIDTTWTIPADAGADLEGIIDDLLAELRSNTGPDEPTISEPDFDDLDEGIDDPSEVGLAQERSDFLRQEGYVYTADYKGNPHWEKKWPLSLPIKTGKTILTHLMIHPGHGQIWYSLVDAAGRPKGGYSIKLPGSNEVPYTTSLRRALLKMRHVAERMPVDANFNDMFTFLRVAFDKVEAEVDSEARTVTEGADDIDYENYVKTSANYNPVQLLSAKDVRKIVKDTGYSINSLYHSKRTTGYSLRIMPGNAEQFQAMKEQPDREASRMLDQIRQGIIARLPMLGKIERGMYNIDDKLQVHCWAWGDSRYKEVPDDPRNFLLYVDIQPSDHQRRGPMGKMLPEGVDDPEGYVNRLERAQYCPRCQSRETQNIETYDSPSFRVNGRKGPQEYWKCNACGDKFLWSDDRSVGFKLESVPDPDADLNPEAYANDTLNMDQILPGLGYRYMADALFPHWQKYITPSVLFVVLTGVAGVSPSSLKWQFQVYRPISSGEWALKTSSPGREISTVRADLAKWEKEANAGTLLSGVNESDEDIDPQDYAKTTFDIVHFLKERGWELHSIMSREYYAKTFPTPKPYQLGGMTFTGVQVRVGVNMFATGETWIGLYFVDSTNNGMPIHAYDLEMQQLFPWEDSDSPPLSYFDNKMPVRRFVAGLDDVLAAVDWPDTPAALKASSRLLHALARFITGLNQQAEKPLHPEVREIGENVDDPDETEINRRMRELPVANYRELVVALDRVQEMEAILTQPAASHRIRGYVAFDEEVVFGDRKRMAIQVIASESDDETGWSQGVLFDAAGHELGTTDVGESFLGEFTVADEGVNYTVKVVAEKMTEALDPDDPESVLQSQPGFEFRETSFLGTMIFLKGPGEDTSDWPQDIGRLIFGPEPNPPYQRKRWYVIGVRGVAAEQLDEYGFGIHKHEKLRTFDTKEDAALAVWLTWSRFPREQQRGYLLPNT